jgi:hypothetical protein
LRHRAAGDARTARVAHLGQIDGEEVHHAAQQWKRKEDEQPVHVLVVAHHVHRKKQRNDDVKPDSEKRHVKAR